MTTENPRPQFDEPAALQALEQLRDQILDARSRREQKLAEFDAFVRSNRAASQAERLAAVIELEGSLPAVQTAARAADRARDLALPQRVADPPPPAAATTARLEPIDSWYSHAYGYLNGLQPQRDPFAVAPSIWQDRRYQIAAGIAALLILLLLFVRPWRDSPADITIAAASAPAGTAATPQGTPALPPGAPASAPSPAAGSSPGTLQIELTTIRPVWMRVTVDGERQVERQVPGGQRLAFGADRAIVLRAGDAGAVRLAIGGADQGLLGRNGEVVDRTLTAGRR